MTDSTTPAPSPIWDFLKTPWVGTVAIALVSAIISAVGGLWTAGFFMPPPPPPRKVETVSVVPAPNLTLQACQAAEQAVHTFRAEFHERFPAKRKPATAAKK